MTHSTQLRMDETLHRRSKMAAAASDVSQAEFVRRAIAAAVDRVVAEYPLLGLMLEYVNGETARG